ncbi:casein kinase substrate phosphoprotein PP28-domain-containing protein [Auriculariales sp. MPI-PUGE-AT-0066]|nr:casein kinase substrate phosphoprotein PP28-domain-containing protein [Auriculariales sp. MPI-PUGE-AT-0066]
MVRGGKFKTRRGGGRSFSKDMHLDSEGTAVGTDPRARRPRPGDVEEEDEDDEDEEEEEEESSEEEEDATAAAGTSATPAGQELSRAERKALKKKQGPKKGAPGAAKGSDDEEDDDDDDDLVNPNHVQKKLTISDIGAPRELSRREREQKEKQEAKEKYMKLHLAGKTDQAKADIARLAKIRKDREEAAARRKAEADAKADEIKAKETAQRQRRA